MSAFLILLLFPAIGILGVWGVKALDQDQRDRNRKTYRLAFPSDLDADRVAAWLRAISGTLKTGPGNWTGVPTIAFEVWATNHGISHRLKVPWQHADFIIMELRALVPGIRVTPEDDWPAATWTRAIEASMTHSERTLRIFNAADMSHSLLASIQGLNEGEAVVMQWVVTPARPAHLPQPKEARTTELNLRTLTSGGLASRDEVSDRREKLSDPNVLAVLRIAAQAETPVRADHLLYRVRAALAAVRGPSTRFKRRLVGRGELQRRIDSASGLVNFPIQLTAAELSALIAWPIGNPFITGLPPVMSRHLQTPETVPREGRLIGRSNMPGNERPIAVSYLDARKHMHVMGPTGVGKTALLANMLRQDVEAGYGVILIEAKGDLFQQALDYIPKRRAKDVVVLDVNDTSRPVGFNILEQGQPRVVVDELMALFQHLYGDTKGVWERKVLYHGLLTLVHGKGLAFPDLGPLLLPTSDEEAWRDQLVSSLKDAELKRFWHDFLKQPASKQEQIVQPVMDRIWQINARPELRNILGQGTSSFSMSDVIRDNKILLINLAGMPKETVTLAGTLLFNAIWNAAKTTKSDRESYLYLDEFQSYMDLPIDPEDMLAKARSFGLGMTLAHQHLGQLPSELKQAIMANARTKVVFQTSSEDARTMEREFGTKVGAQDFMNLGKYEAIARIATGDGVSPPVTLATYEPHKSYRTAGYVRSLARQTYGRPVGEVEAAVMERRRADPTMKTQRPRISGWG